MLPLSHTYITMKVTGRENNLLLFGSVLPDIRTTYSRKIGDRIHNSPQTFYDFINRNHPELLDIALGVKLHSAESRGADYYSDNLETGYAYIEGKTLREDVAALVKSKDPMYHVLAHNFIEIALDMHIRGDHHQILDTFEEALNSVDEKKIAEAVSLFLDHDKKECQDAIEDLKVSFAAKHFRSIENIAEGLALPIIKRKFDISVDKHKAIKLIEKAMDLTKDDYHNFLDSTIVSMKKDFNFE